MDKRREKVAKAINKFVPFHPDELMNVADAAIKAMECTCHEEKDCLHHQPPDEPTMFEKVARSIHHWGDGVGWAQCKECSIICNKATEAVFRCLLEGAVERITKHDKSLERMVPLPLPNSYDEIMQGYVAAAYGITVSDVERYTS